MEQSFDVNLLRNVQAADSKSSVSKEFVGLKNRREKNRAKRGAVPNYPQKAGKGFREESSGSGEEEQQGSKIDITI